MRVLGLMSGTSGDGVDAVLVEFHGNPNKPSWEILNSSSIPYPEPLRQFVVNAGQGMKMTSQEFLNFSEVLTEFNAYVALSCDPSRSAQLIGCHGQTIFHRPPVNGKRGASSQILQAPLLSTIANRPVVFDFRAKDLALGGQGAPLVPLVDEALIGRATGWRAILNLGGIANLTIIPPSVGPDRFAQSIGWDSGPANSLLDLAVAHLTNGKYFYDHDGKLASRGKSDLSLIRRWLKEPFFQKISPKSTGREFFGKDDLEQRLVQMKGMSLEDVIATLTTFTASIIAQDLDNLFQRDLIKPVDLIVGGGGVKNYTLMNQIRCFCKGIRVCSIESFGIPATTREPLAFALLAWWHWRNKKSNSQVITGAKRSSILGTRVNPS